MKSLLLVVSLALAVVAPAAAQTPYETLLAYRGQYPTPMTAPQAAELLNRVAWDYRALGMRLLGKTGGENCPLPNGTLISCDFLVHGPTLTGFDVMSGAVGGPGTVFGFVWGPGPEPLAAAIASGARTLVDPIQPAGTAPPVVVPPPVVSPPPVVVFDTTEIVRRLLAIEADLVIIKAEGHDTKTLAADADQQIKEHRAGVQAVWLKVSAIGGPIVAAVVTWIQMRSAPAPAAK